MVQGFPVEVAKVVDVGEESREGAPGIPLQPTSRGISTAFLGKALPHLSKQALTHPDG